MTASKLLELYWEYSQPRIGRIGPSGCERRGEQRSNIKFVAWVRVVTEPRYPEFEHLVKNGYPAPEFEDILTESLKWTPFVYKEGEPVQDLRGALIPVSAATIYAGVHQTTIMRWIDRGLKHEKRGSYYWVSVQDLERFFNLKHRHKTVKHRNKREKSYKPDINGVRLAS